MASLKLLHSSLWAICLFQFIPARTFVKWCHCFTKVPACDYFHSFRSFLLNRWQSFWSDLLKNAVKRLVSPWSNPCHKNWQEQIALTQLRKGYTNLTHSYLMTHSPPILCITCNNLSLYITFFLSLLHCCPSCSFPLLNSSILIPHHPLLNDILTESPHFHLETT